MRTTSCSWAIRGALLLAACTPKKDKPDAVASAHGSSAAASAAPRAVGTLHVESPAFATNGKIPVKFTCEGSDTRPALGFSGVPGQAKSLALIVDDPDAPNGTWVHWVVYNLPPSTTRIGEGAAALPAGAIAGLNDFKKNSYGGPCPPSGRHRYFFKLYALDTLLPKLDDATEAGLEHAMRGHIVAKGELMGTYQKGD